MTTSETETQLALLRAFHRDKLTLRERHVAAAREVRDYEFNNTYQYIIAREDVHLSWLEAAIAEMAGTPDTVPAAHVPPLGRGQESSLLTRRDAEGTQAFVNQWRPRLAEMTNARHRNLMNVVLGETLEQKRFFDQMSSGRRDVLGRRANGAGSPGTGDGVMSVRWMSDPVRVAIALGSNLGDRAAHLTWAADALGSRLGGLRLSRAIESLPVDVPDEQPPYLNAVAVGETSLVAEDLLAWLLDLERQRGRTRERPRAARTLDLDLILYGAAVIDRSGLTVPHPRFRDRPFVLEPLAELAPEFVDPVTGKTVGELWRDWTK